MDEQYQYDALAMHFRISCKIYCIMSQGKRIELAEYPAAQSCSFLQLKYYFKFEKYLTRIKYVVLEFWHQFC